MKTLIGSFCSKRFEEGWSTLAKLDTRIQHLIIKISVYIFIIWLPFNVEQNYELSFSQSNGKSNGR